MHRAAILAYDDCYASSLGGFADVLQVANAHLRRRQGAATSLFEWRFVSMSGQAVTTSNGLQLQTDKPGPRDRFDLVFVPSAHYAGRKPFDRLLRNQMASCAWLVAQWNAGALLAANCTGTFILAQTGLLDDRPATTTWWLEQQFRSHFPRVNLQLEPVLTEADRLICAGASASYLLQAIRIVERLSGPVIASQCAKTMLIDVSQTKQTPYLPLLSDKAHADSVVHRAQHLLQKNMINNLGMSDLAAALGVSERTLIRRFRSALERTPLAYLQDLRLEAARGLLETGDLGVEEIACRVGYIDASSFSRLFRQRIGMSPGAYRDRFHLPGNRNDGDRRKFA
ncbi:GlxA family transcriptional regulator [Paraburkholderia terrae]|uniref:GlxA family transcriptional regulator n=1 Tax=Paraburkholderia terrae TaxID=311230 RepID=UPI00296AE999|nr:helix-turn-helix domain-containing protein [Paraburkholderia terrae]MDW3659772.1 helix-turn-helix domain-containing protein [Paraburkholderia terrae]